MPIPVREIEVDEVLPKGTGPAPGPGARPGDDLVAALVAKIMDSLFKIPGTNISVGLDPLIGLIPGAGSPISAFVSLMMLARSARNGVPNLILARMALNVAINAMLDAIPVVGDAASIFYRSNARNYELMLKHAGTRRHAGWPDKLFLLLLMVSVILFVVVMVVGMVVVVRTGLRELWPVE
ncbi:MAG TPA: DUF4112 domain-containing protein [Chthoniobacteraceae bacterium]|jgi:hypothetical protein|nr:DUF4112 domain-containing protein [Chthoniobacteraceae bacterium]